MNPETFEATFAEHYPGLARRLAMIVGDEAEGMDLAQEAYLRAFRSRSTLDGRDPRGFIYTIGYRLALNELRRRKRQALRLVRLVPTPASLGEGDPDLWNALQLLGRRERAALLLNVIDGYTQREIGELLGVPEGTVASWVSRAKTGIRTELKRGDRDG